MTRETAIGRLLTLVIEESEFRWGLSRPDHYRMWESELGVRPTMDDEEDVRELTKLKELATIAGGWFVWSKEEGDACFVPMSKWLAMFQEWRDAGRPLS